MRTQVFWNVTLSGSWRFERSNTVQATFITESVNINIMYENATYSEITETLAKTAQIKMSKFGYHTCTTNQNQSKQCTICMILGSNGGVAEGWTLLGSDADLLGK